MGEMADWWSPEGPFMADPDEPPVCDHCLAKLVRRKGKHGEFWACPNWGRKGCSGTTVAISQPAPSGDRSDPDCSYGDDDYWQVPGGFYEGDYSGD